MQRILIDDIWPGAIIAKDIYNSEGIMLIAKGASFCESFSKRLEEVGINEVFVEETVKRTAYKQENIKDASHIDDIIYEKTRTHAQMQIKKTMVKFSTVCRINLDKISKIVESIIEQLLTKKDIVLTLSKLRSIDDYTYEHSVNVCVLSLIVGIDLSLDKDALKNLGIGAILHDIGKVGISENILKKPSKLTYEEFEEIKRHTDYGYEILKKSGATEEAAQIALHHHEKYDGTGYNQGLKGNNIPLFSRIVAVADVYDAMSNDRVYKKKKSPDKVYKEIAHLGDTHFDTTIMEKFVHHLSLYPIGTGVVLNTNHKGVVIGHNRMLPESPIVRLFRKEKTDIRNLYKDIDLSMTKYVYIKDTF